MDKILVIDDSAVQAEFIKNMLQDDYDVTVCQTAEKGLQCARTGVYSLILLDVIMPVYSAQGAAGNGTYQALPGDSDHQP